MKARGYEPSDKWYNPYWRGSKLKNQDKWSDLNILIDLSQKEQNIYPEHNDKYLIECLENLKEKGIDLYKNLTK